MKKIILYGLGIGLLGSSIYWYISKQKKLLSNFSYNITGVKFTTVTMAQIDVTLTIKFTSSSDIEATINNVYLDVYIDKDKVGYITNPQAFIIPSHASSLITLTLSFNPKTAFGNIIDAVFGNSINASTNLIIDGYANIKSGFINTTLPVKYSLSLKDIIDKNKGTIANFKSK